MWFVNGKVAKKPFFWVEWTRGWEDRALQECNPSAQSSVDCGSIRSWRCRQAAPGDDLSGMLEQATV
jgi:hypothetical protein